MVLSTTKTTRVIFRPRIHQGGVRGHIIRQKIGSDGEWKDDNEVNFNCLPADCGVSIELTTEALSKLYERLKSLDLLQRHGPKRGRQTYVVAAAEETIIIGDQTKAAAIQALLDNGQSEAFWRALAKSNPDLATRLAAAQLQFERLQGIAEFEASLNRYTSNESYWQEFFETRPWILQSAFPTPVLMLNGETYLGGKRPVSRQGKGGVVTDFLFADESTKSFAVVEIKTPHAKLIGGLYRGEEGTGFDNEVYEIHPGLTGALVQTRNQIAVAVDYFQGVLGEHYHGRLSRVHPTGVLVVGMAAALSQREKDSFNHFRHGLHSLTVITFDELLLRLKLLYTEERGLIGDDIPWPDGPLDSYDSGEELGHLEDLPVEWLAGTQA